MTIDESRRALRALAASQASRARGTERGGLAARADGRSAAEPPPPHQTLPAPPLATPRLLPAPCSRTLLLVSSPAFLLLALYSS